MRLKNILALAVVTVLALLLAAPAFAAGENSTGGTAAAATADAGKSGAGIGAGVGAGLAIVGAGIGIGLVGFGALGAIARQPEQKGAIQVNMIVMAALVEGVAIIALLVICFALVGVTQAK